MRSLLLPNKVVPAKDGTVMTRLFPPAMNAILPLTKCSFARLNSGWPGLQNLPVIDFVRPVVHPLMLAIILVVFGSFPVSAYTNLGNNVLLSNGSAADTQSAINAASNGTTIEIANGSYTWNQQVTNANGIFVHLIAQTVGGVTITRTYTGGHLIVLNASPNGNVELGGINFTSNLTGSNDNYSFTVNVNQLSGRPVLVHDCSFVTGYEYGLQFQGNGGVVWNCSFATHSDQVGGITFVNTSSTNAPWNQPSSIGMAGDPTGTLNTYIENCTFRDATIAMANFDDNSRVVWRYNTMNNAALASHGQETSLWGTRHWEIYGNTFNYSTSGTAFGGDAYPLNMNYWFQARGGTGVVTNNAMDDIPLNKAGVQLNVFSINRSDSISCQTGYPAARQTGQGWSASSTATYGNPVVPQDGTGDVTDPVYVWNNSGTETTDPGYVGVNQYTPDDCGNGELIQKFLQQGRDYFVNVSRPNWTPYTYPHPLRAEAGANPPPTSSPTPTPVATPAAPQDLRVTQ